MTAKGRRNVVFIHQGSTHLVELQQNGSAYFVEVGRKTAKALVVKASGQELRLVIDGNELPVLWAKQGRKIWLHFDRRSYYLEKHAGSAASSGAAASGERTLRAPMPGQVRQVQVRDGQAVKAGETLMLLEAMKMEIRIHAPGDGKVARVAVKQGQTVEKEQTLVELE